MAKSARPTKGNCVNNILTIAGNNTAARTGLRALAATLLLAAASLAHAQYVWTDDKGLKVYSDQPPPVSVPVKRILKAPGHTADASAAMPAATAAAAGDGGDGPASPAPAPADRPKGQPSVAEQEAAYRKRKAAEAAAAQKAAEDAQRKNLVATNCANARQEQQTMASGERVSTVDASGERSYMSDEERAARLNKARQALASCQ
jgi:hypothetical protein